jgi:glycosyltransferase involved in cell wall biosynthesis
MTRKDENQIRARESLGPHDADDSYESYQIEFLLNEIKYTERINNSFVWRINDFLGVKFRSRYLRQFYWTITRFCGFGYLHDGSRSPARPILVQEHVALKDGPRILLDVTETHRNKMKTGVQRVVSEIAKASVANGDALPVIIENGHLTSYFRHPDLPERVEISEGDRYVVLDTGFSLPQEYLPVIQEVVQRGGRAIYCIYDLIPLLYPGMLASRTSHALRDWLETSLPYCDAVVTISKSVADDFLDYVLAKDVPCNPALRVGWFHLGVDFAAKKDGSASQHVRAICEKTPFFLTVGTLEPRKNHVVALAAFDLLWRAGVDVHYVITGKMGWLLHALRDRIMRHPEFGRRLFWLHAADDTDLSHLYRHAAALIQPSIAEGFGLPIVEAAHYGTPVIASDIRVFREIGGAALAYFDPMDPHALAECIRAALIAPRIAPSITLLSWGQATERLIALVKDETYAYSLLDHRQALSG